MMEVSCRTARRRTRPPDVGATGRPSSIPPGRRPASMRIVFVSWRDLAHPQAGGAEVVLDHLAVGLRDRGHDVALVCGGPVATRPYRVIRNGGTYSQYVEVPLTFWR